MATDFFIEEMSFSIPKSPQVRRFRHIPSTHATSAQPEPTPVVIDLDYYATEAGQALMFGAAPDVDHTFQKHLGSSLSDIVKEWKSVRVLENQLHVTRCELGQAEIELEKNRAKLMEFRTMPFIQRLKFLFQRL